MSDELEAVTVAAGKTVITGGGWPAKSHGPGSVIHVTPAEAGRLRATGHAIDPAAQLVKVSNPLPPGGSGTASIGVGAGEPLVNPGSIGGAK